VGDAPSSFILKTARPDRLGGGWNGGQHEVAFYHQVASAMPAVVAPRCFEAFCDAETNDIPPVIWWNNLERILLAVDDLGCRDLLF
jgi:hypothetical protein